MVVEVRILSWNIAYGQKMGFDLSRIATLIRETDAHVACIQEIGDGIRPLGGTLHQPQDLASRASLPYWRFGADGSYWDGPVGNAILSRYPLGPAIVHPFGGSGQTFVEAGARLDDVSVHFLCAHPRYPAIDQCAERVAALVSQLPGEQAVFFGADMNSVPGEYAMNVLEQQLTNSFRMRDDRAACTSLGEMIDYVMHRGPYEVVATEHRCPGPQNEYPTDHPYHLAVYRDTRAASADLSITMTGPVSVQSGEEVVYRTQVKSRGPSLASDVIVTDQIPFPFVSAAATRGSISAPPAGERGTVTWTIGSFAPADTGSLEIRCESYAYKTNTFHNIARVSSSTYDPQAGNNSASVQTLVYGERG